MSPEPPPRGEDGAVAVEGGRIEVGRKKSTRLGLDDVPRPGRGGSAASPTSAASHGRSAARERRPSTIRGARSVASTRPLGPTARAARSALDPRPQPRSSTLSPWPGRGPVDRAAGPRSRRSRPPPGRRSRRPGRRRRRCPTGRSSPPSRRRGRGGLAHRLTVTGAGAGGRGPRQDGVRRVV